MVYVEHDPPITSKAVVHTGAAPVDPAAMSPEFKALLASLGAVIEFPSPLDRANARIAFLEAAFETLQAKLAERDGGTTMNVPTTVSDLLTAAMRAPDPTQHHQVLEIGYP